MTQDLEAVMAESLEGTFTAYAGRESVHSYDKQDALQCHYAGIRSIVRIAARKAAREAEKALNADAIVRAAKSPRAALGPLNVEWRPKMATFMLAVSQITGVSIMDLKSARRDRHTVHARHMFFWLCRYHTPCSFPQIARFSNRDWNTVMHGVKKVSKTLADYPELVKIKTLLGVGEHG